MKNASDSGSAKRVSGISLTSYFVFVYTKTMLATTWNTYKCIYSSNLITLKMPSTIKFWERQNWTWFSENSLKFDTDSLNIDRIQIRANYVYSGAAEPPVRRGVSHVSGPDGATLL